MGITKITYNCVLHKLIVLTSTSLTLQAYDVANWVRYTEHELQLGMSNKGTYTLLKRYAFPCLQWKDWREQRKIIRTVIFKDSKNYYPGKLFFPLHYQVYISVLLTILQSYIKSITPGWHIWCPKCCGQGLHM